MPTTSWCCAKATKKQRPPWCESVPGSRTTVFVCIRTKRILATAATEAKGLNSSATGLKLEGVMSARRASTVSRIVSGPRPGARAAKASRALSKASTGPFRDGSITSNTRITALDQFIRRGLRAILRKQAKRPGFGKTHADHRQWPSAFFAEAGLLALKTAHQNAKHSR